MSEEKKNPRVRLLKQRTALVANRNLVFNIEQGQLLEADGSPLQPGALMVVDNTMQEPGVPNRLGMVYSDKAMEEALNQLSTSKESGISFGSFTRNRPTSIGDEHGSRDKFGNLLLDPNRKEDEDDSINFPTVGLGVDFFVHPGLQACIDEHATMIGSPFEVKPGDLPRYKVDVQDVRLDLNQTHSTSSLFKRWKDIGKYNSEEPELLDLSKGKRYLNEGWVDWYQCTHDCWREEAWRTGAEKMMDREFNEKMRVNVEILPVDPANPLHVKIKYHDKPKSN